MQIDIQCEPASELWSEIQPILDANWREIAHYADIPLAIRRDVYDALEKAGALRVFTVRDAGKLVGYAVFIVQFAPHYSTSKQAHQDVLFLLDGYRGISVGRALISIADRHLEAEGVQVVTHKVKHAHDFGGLLLALDYEPMETMYCRRLDHGL